jgi:hypothetical protein
MQPRRMLSAAQTQVSEYFNVRSPYVGTRELERDEYWYEVQSNYAVHHAPRTPGGFFFGQILEPEIVRCLC